MSTIDIVKERRSVDLFAASLGFHVFVSAFTRLYSPAHAPN